MKNSHWVAFVIAAVLVTTASAQETLPEDALACTGNGLISVVADQCMHDGGSSASGDSLEIYCHDGIARFCLSGETCPWRQSPSDGGDATCSNAGLDSDWMASAWCNEWSGFDHFSCTEQGEIQLRQRTEAEKLRDMGEGC